MEIQFSRGFLWGAATSSHQVEGGNRNDWTEYETKSAKQKAQHAKQKSWPDYILKNYPNPRDEENYISGRACDHHNRFQDDFDIVKSLGHNAHRFSVEWSRIEPEEGKFSEKEVEHYREVISALREREIEPFITLWHWTLPGWIVSQGGWESKSLIFYFSRFCRKVIEAFSKDVKFWIVLNEPSLWAADAYLFGIKPPQKKNILKMATVYFRLIRAQQEVYKIAKEINSKLQIGISESCEWLEPRILPNVFRPLLHYFRNFFFLRRIKSSVDFIGVNYYKKIHIGGGEKPDASDMGWEVYPEGLFYLLRDIWHLYHIPLFVTENGMADAMDQKRAEFIRSHLFWVQRAIIEGVDVRGYFHWSLLDSFEWQDGFWPRFGLVEVDYMTMERRVRESARIYAEIIKNAKFEYQHSKQILNSNTPSSKRV